ncbi:uncharacterized protein [Diadema antillarum]|uniref:uncharacterized protein n=1 Tax=Diadema antillarum TaxID=105358 RepID=UPI003A854CC7
MSPIPKANEPGNNPKAAGEDGDDLEPPPHGFAAGMPSSEDDSDDGDAADVGYGGYQLLAQDPEHVGMDSDEDSEEVNEASSDDFPPRSPAEDPSSSSDVSNTSSNTLEPSLPTHLAKLLPTAPPVPDTASLVSHTDTEASLEQRKKRMATDEQIRAAMAGFSLPTTAIPAWAKSLEEEDWKEKLVASIQNKHEKQQRTGSGQRGGGGKK